MAPTVVYKGIHNDQPNAEALFTGQKIWFSKTVPQRTRFIEDVKANGGEVVPLEKQADIRLYDHARKDTPPGMYSYRYVEYSVRKGQLEDLDAHKIGGLSSRAARPVGSVTWASKGTKTTFTAADDQMLRDWLKPYQGMKGSAGNVIYQQLEAANPRHTYQSWRDRWLKKLQYQNRDGMSNSKTGQQATAPREEKPSLTRTPLKASRSRIDGASDFPRIVVEVPVKESPRRKRGRPPKVRQGGSHGETIHVASSVTTTQSSTPMKSMRKESDSRPQLEMTPTSKQRSDAGSWEFSNEERNLLLAAAEAILEIPKDESGPAWEQMAEVYRSHTAEQWKSYFHEVIVPYHHKLQKKSQERKKKTSIDAAGTDGRHEEGDTTKAQSSRRKKGKSQTIETSSEDVRQDRNGDTVSTPPRSSPCQRSPSFTPQSPADWKSEADGNRPAPNQSRKRSPAKTSSQESAGSPDLGSPAHKMQHLRRISGVRQHESEDTEWTPLPSAKRRKLSLADNPVLEIQSTPEHTQESETLEDLLGTPTPRARRRPLHELERSFSPLYVTSDTADEDDHVPTASDRTSRRKETMEPETRTSPISVHLVSDHEPGITSSLSGPRDHKVDIASPGSPTPEFETAPDFSQNHEDTDRDEFETAAEQAQAAQRNFQPNTQAFISNASQHGEGSFDFGLPDPEGGWEAMDPDLNHGERSNRGERTTSPTPSTTSTSTSNLDIDSWVQLRVSEGKDIKLLLTAAEATNLHKTLADSVYESLERGRGIPTHVRGVWTKEDDGLLMGTDARGVERVERKHGATSVAERWECLHVWQD
ncbi:hypothetical protein GJ744_002529 [Endocarpon pusillum]|uniref:DNA-binding protein RAP1 n=1 Tax=Endocarpon pusillum TaxID=364733 RepID=A0A8H7ABW1_9EURO|nr:hypothetical protein GJ744_002529 [Endocarpon pusillum]